MYHIQVTRKNCFNKSRAVKAQLLEQVIAALPTQSFPNGNSGYNSYYARPMIQYFENCIVREVGGDPHTPNYVLLDASKLKSEQIEKIKDWLKPVHGNKYFRNELGLFVGMAARTGSPWEIFGRLIEGVCDQKLVSMHRQALLNDTSPDRWRRLHTAFDGNGVVLQVAKAEDIKTGFAYLHDGSCLYKADSLTLHIPTNPKQVPQWYDKTGTAHLKFEV